MRPLLPFALLTLASLPAAAAEPAKPPAVPKPAATRGDEPLAKVWSPAKAGEYLDGVAVNWTRDRKCLTCHTNMPYLLSRPLLPGGAWKEVRAFAENQSAGWEKSGKGRNPSFVIINAFVLAFNDAQAKHELHPRARYSLDAMWELQLPTGEWKWLKCDLPPMEYDDYYGATVAALAAAVAPGGYAQTEKAEAGLAKLKGYFAKNPAPDLHHRTMLLWASTKLPGLLAADRQAAAVRELRAKQRADGGWSLPSLGEFERQDGTPNDPAAPSDGYATGLATYVLIQAGTAPTDPAVAKAAAWLKANQQESGRWYTRSLNNDKAHYITNAGSAFAVLALAAAGAN